MRWKVVCSDGVSRAVNSGSGSDGLWIDKEGAVRYVRSLKTSLQLPGCCGHHCHVVVEVPTSIYPPERFPGSDSLLRIGFVRDRLYSERPMNGDDMRDCAKALMLAMENLEEILEGADRQ